MILKGFMGWKKLPRRHEKPMENWQLLLIVRKLTGFDVVIMPPTWQILDKFLPGWGLIKYLFNKAFKK
ncbi:hypothetical protein [Hydrogenovibrio marinus]|uniref:hypothetical protein n=1 Tax=Hydrogenovibrio marinus TaxID=28885 RepID=UPI00138DF00F|nr:hypothetical protein [Hydrogenovibrio marinus]